MNNLFTLMIILIGLLIIVTIMSILWLVHLKTKNASFVDIGWATGILIMSFLFFLFLDGYQPRKNLVIFIISIWAIRLILLLVTRIKNDRREDKRYSRIRNDWNLKDYNTNFLFYLLFQFQGILSIILSIPVLIVCLNPSTTISKIEILGVLVSLIGIIFETVADLQLKNYKSIKENKNKVFDKGLWKYSRHPNYFFEWLVWVGLFIFAIPAPCGLWAIIAPALMLYFLIMQTGINMTERECLESKGEDYALYQKRTSSFVPLPKMKGTQ